MLHFTLPKNSIKIQWTDYQASIIIQKKCARKIIISTYCLVLNQHKIRLWSIISRGIEAWTCSKNISWIMAKWLKCIKIRCIIILLLVFGHLLGDDILDGQIRWNMHLKWTKIGKNVKTKIHLERDAFYAAEYPTNIR